MCQCIVVCVCLHVAVYSCVYMCQCIVVCVCLHVSVHSCCVCDVCVSTWFFTRFTRFLQGLKIIISRLSPAVIIQVNF